MLLSPGEGIAQHYRMAYRVATKQEVTDEAGRTFRTSGSRGMYLKR